MKITFLFAFVLVAHSASAEQIAAVTCPEILHLTATIGQIRSGNSDFQVLSNSHFESDFQKSNLSPGECVLIERLPGDGDGQIDLVGISTANRRYIQIGRDRRGEAVIVLNGYTAHGNLFAIRAGTGNDFEPGNFRAWVFEGAGTHQSLGAANLELQ